MKAVISQWCGLFVLRIMTLSQSLRFRHVDPSVMERAVGKSRILITEDKDFGQLVYATMQRTGGVIFIRFPARARRSLAATVVELVRRRGESLIT